MGKGTKRKTQEVSIRWPRRGDRAFSQGTRRSVQAFPKWLPVSHRQDMIGEGFRAAADHVVRVLETGQEHRYADMFFNPVAYLYRHFLEVSMKSLLQQGMRLSLIPKTDEASLGHNLHALWQRTRRLIETLWPDGEQEPLLAVEKVVLDFHQLDRSGQELRYAVDTKGKPCLEKAPNQVCLLNLRDVMEGVYNFLMGCDAQLGYLADCQESYADSF